MDLNSLLLVALIVLLGLAFVYMRKSLKRLRRQRERTATKTLRAGKRRPAPAPGLDDLWAQIEAFITLYRFMDDLEALPTTRGWAASPDILLHLVNHLQVNPVHKIIECGSGSSTVVLAYAFKKLNRDGHIWAIESNPAIAKNLESAGGKQKYRGSDRRFGRVDHGLPAARRPLGSGDILAEISDRFL